MFAKRMSWSVLFSKINKETKREKMSFDIMFAWSCFELECLKSRRQDGISGFSYMSILNIFFKLSAFHAFKCSKLRVYLTIRGQYRKSN